MYDVIEFIQFRRKTLVSNFIANKHFLCFLFIPASKNLFVGLPLLSDPVVVGSKQICLANLLLIEA